MSRGRPSKWDEGGGVAPFNIGRDPEKYDKDGLFRTERDLKEDWDTYLASHPVGTTERKWDRRMTAEVSDRISGLLKVAGARTALSSGLRNVTDLVAKTKRFKKRSDSDYGDWLDKHGSGNFTNADIFITLATTAEDIAEKLDGTLETDASLEQVSRCCDALKEKCHSLIYKRRLAQLEDDRKRETGTFKARHAEVKALKDDLVYLVAKMRAEAHEQQQTDDDEDHELPPVEQVLLGLPSRNRLRRRDTMTDAAPERSVSSSATSSSAGFSTTRSRSSEDDGDDDERPAKRMTRSTSAESEESAESAAVESEESGAAAAAAGTSWF